MTMYRLEVRRVVEAPANRVFAAITTPDLMRNWVCPGDAVPSRLECNPIPGGRYVIDMKLIDGTVLTVSGEYLDVTAGERVAYTWKWAHEDEVSQVTITLHPRGAATEVVLVHERLGTVESRDGHTQGWEACLAKLAAFASPDTSS
jgi:uncharacterized protein YndB with AHSA1/START domain